MLNLSQYFPITDPTLIFFVVLLIILFAPIIMGQLRIPHIIGMVLAGVLVGTYGLNILQRDDSFELFGNVGLYYIMFLAGLEIDMESLKKNKGRLGLFGLLTFLLPFALTFFMGVWLLKYTPMASLLLGCIMSSNTLIAYPIVCRYGLQRHSSSMLSVGASMISLSLALIVMAAVVNAVGANGSSRLFWVWFVLKVGFFCTGMIFFIPRLVRWFFRKYSDAVMQFTLVLAILFLSAALSSYIGLEGIFGAFFAGLILNRFIPHVSPLMNRIEFIGNALFIPYFLIGVGMLINIHLLFQGGNILWVVGCIVFFGTVGKALAAYLSNWLFRLPFSSGNMMFGLTSAHAAGAIAIVMIGFKLEIMPGHPLFDDEILNGIIIMILVTCIISTLTTEQAAKQIRLQEKENPQPLSTERDDEKILVPVKYPEYADHLLSMAMMMRNHKLNRELIALNVVLDDVNAAANQAEGHRLLEHLQKNASAANVPMVTQVRLSTNIANGIKHAFKEFQASEIIMGLHFHTKISKQFWGQFTQSLYNGLPTNHHRPNQPASQYYTPHTGGNTLTGRTGTRLLPVDGAIGASGGKSGMPYQLSRATRHFGPCQGVFPKQPSKHTHRIYTHGPLGRIARTGLHGQRRPHAGGGDRSQGYHLLQKRIGTFAGRNKQFLQRENTDDHLP